MKNLLLIIGLTLLMGCGDLGEKKITIGNPQKEPGVPEKREYIVLAPEWENDMPLYVYVSLTDSVLAELTFRLDSLEYLLNQK